MKSKLILILAFVTISTGLYGLSGSILGNNEVGNVNVNQPAEQISYRVWRLKQPMKKGQELTRSDLKLQVMSEEEAIGFGVFEQERIAFNKALYLKKDMKALDVVHREDTLKSNDPGYIDLIISPGQIPFNLSIDAKSIVGGSISIGDMVDIATVSSSKQNLSQGDIIDDVSKVKMAPLITQVRVLDIISNISSQQTRENKEMVVLIIEINSRELAKLTIAQRIADLEVNKSIGREFSKKLYANSSDIIHTSTVHTVREFRTNRGK